MKPPSRRKNPSQRLSRKLNHRLTHYALAAGAGFLATPQPAPAEVVFTPANITLTDGQLQIDLNHDGVTDFILSNKSLGGSCCFYTRKLDVTGAFVGSSQNAVEGIGQNAAALEAGAVIGPRDLFLAAKMQMAGAFNDSNSFFYVFGAFANKTNRFLGLRFVLNGKNHFGWARFSVVRAGFSGSIPVIRATLSGYAFETVAGRPIVAGRTRSLSASLASPSDLAPAPATSATLGLLAMGAPALDVWRRD